VGRVSELSDPDDRKLVTLARATRARTGAAEGAALRDADGRTYAAATVDLPSLRVSAIGVAVAMAVASGSRGVEAVVVLTEATAWPAPTSPRCATSGAPACPCIALTCEATWRRLSPPSGTRMRTVRRRR
jgi:hypothetical protein